MPGITQTMTSYQFIRNKPRSLLKAPQIDEFLSKLNGHLKHLKWLLQENEKGPYLKTQLTFSSAQDALSMLAFIDTLQTEVDHHMGLVLRDFSTLDIQLCTHQPRYGVTEVDTAFAECLSQYVEQRQGV